MEETFLYTGLETGKNSATAIARKKPGFLLKHPLPLQPINPLTHENVQHRFPYLKARQLLEDTNNPPQVEVTEQDTIIRKRQLIVDERIPSNATTSTEIFYEASPIQEGIRADVSLENQEIHKYMPTLVNESFYTIVPKIVSPHMPQPLPTEINLNFNTICGYQGSTPRFGVLEIEKELNRDELVLLQILSDEIDLLDKEGSDKSSKVKWGSVLRSACGLRMTESEYLRRYPWSTHLSQKYPKNESEEDEIKMTNAEYDLDDVYESIYE